jgi:ABC-type sugar transport system substrate-binding protein
MLKLSHRRPAQAARPRRLLAVFLASAFCWSAAGCGGTGAADSEGGASDEASAAEAEARLAPYLSEVENIAVSTPLTSRPESGKLLYLIRYNIPVAAALDEPTAEAAEALGWELRVLPVDPTDPQAQSNAMKQAVAEGADFIEVSAASEQSMGPGLEAAKEAGIPVFLQAGTTEPAGQQNGIYGNSTDQYVQDAVLRLLDIVIADSKGGGDVLLLSAPDYPILVAVAEAAEEQFPENCPQCSLHIENVSAPDLTGGAAPSLTVATLRKNPQIKYVVASFDALASGLPQALKSAGLDDIQVLVVAPDATMVPGLADGSFTAFAMYPSKSLAWLAVDQLARHSLGMDVDQQAHGIEPYPIWTSDNAPDEGTFDGVSDYQAQYKKLWKIS